MTDTKITADMVIGWDACYDPDRIKCLFSEPRTIIEVLMMVPDGEDIPAGDRLWVVLRPDVLPDPLIGLFACWCAERVLPIFERMHPKDQRPRKAIEVARRYAVGDATKDQLFAAWEAADAARDAARAAAWAAAWTAARDAARHAADAAWAAAWAAARDAARHAADAARDAARDADESVQLTKLIQMIKVWQETGDVFGGENREVNK